MIKLWIKKGPRSGKNAKRGTSKLSNVQIEIGEARWGSFEVDYYSFKIDHK
jgi:hypothetical protein